MGAGGQGPLSFHKCVGLGKALWVGPLPLPRPLSPTWVQNCPPASLIPTPTSKTVSSSPLISPSIHLSI